MKKLDRKTFVWAIALAAQCLFAPMPGLALPNRSLTPQDEAKAIREPDSKKSVLQAVSAIKRQTEEGHLRARTDGTVRAAQVLKQANQLAVHIHSQRDAAISGLAFRATRGSAFFQTQESEIRYQSIVDENAVRQNARLEAARHVRLAAERAQALESAAANLESQLLEGPKRSGVRLTALGTNLYVRNYVSYVEPPVELVATPLVSTAGKYRGLMSGKTTTSVRGKLLVPHHVQ